MKIPLMKNAFLHEQDTKQALAKFIGNTNQLSMGKYCQEFESKFCLEQDTSFSVLFNSGASANLALIQALKNLGRIKEGDQIGFSALTWSTNVMPLIQLGMNPIPLDCELDNLNVSCQKLEDFILTSDIKALFITNVLGFVADLARLSEFCIKNNILLLEDNCESLGTVHQGTKTGNFGLASTFSFYVAHHMSTIEGGMVCTTDEELAEMLKIVRANGWDRNLSSTQQEKWRSKYDITEFQSKYTFYDLGYNLRPTEITGFLGCFQLPFLADTIKTRQKNYLEIKSIMDQNPDFISLKHDHLDVISTFAIPIICHSPEVRKKYLDRFVQKEIEVRPIISGNMQSQPFYSKYIKEMQKLPNTDKIHDCGFYCGNFPELSTEEIRAIQECLVQ